MDYIIEEIPIRDFKICPFNLKGEVETTIINFKEIFLCKAEVEENSGEILFLSTETLKEGAFRASVEITTNTQSYTGVGVVSIGKVGKENAWGLKQNGTTNKATLYKTALDLERGGEIMDTLYYALGKSSSWGTFPPTYKTPAIKTTITNVDSVGVLPAGSLSRYAFLRWDSLYDLDISVGYKKIYYSGEDSSKEYKSIVDLTTGEILYSNVATPKKFQFSFCTGEFVEGEEINVSLGEYYNDNNILFLPKQDFINKINLNYNTKIKIEE